NGVPTGQVFCPDVNNDGSVGPVDAIIAINYNNSLSRIAAQNHLTSVPLPPPSPPFPVIEPTGGGIKGNGLYIDVDGDGRLTSSDQLYIINYLNSKRNVPLSGE